MSNMLGIDYSSSDDDDHKHHKEDAVERMNEEEAESDVDENGAESAGQNENSQSENSDSEDDHMDDDNTEEKAENGWAKLQAEAANASIDVDSEQEQGNLVSEKKEAVVINVDEATQMKNEPPPPAASSRSERKQIRFNVETAVRFSRKLQKMDPKDFRMPDPPVGECPPELLAKLETLRSLGKSNNLSEMIQSRKDFRNPSIYDKLIQVCKINERGTNFPKEDFDPEYWYKQPTYEDLARAQREEYAAKLKKPTKVEHVTGTAKKSNSRPGSSEPAKKSKWDKASSDTLLKQAQHAPANIKYPFSVATSSTTSSTSKTSIPAVGHLTKDKREHSRASSHSK